MAPKQNVTENRSIKVTRAPARMSTAAKPELVIKENTYNESLRAASQRISRSEAFFLDWS